MLFLHWMLVVENPKWISESISASIRSILKKIISINSIKLNRLHSWQREEQERVAKQFCSITVSSDIAQTGCRWGWCGFLVGKCSLFLCTLYICVQPIFTFLRPKILMSIKVLQIFGFCWGSCGDQWLWQGGAIKSLGQLYCQIPGPAGLRINSLHTLSMSEVMQV